MSDALKLLHVQIEPHLQRIEKLLPPQYRLTLIARHTSMDGADIALTVDKEPLKVAGVVLSLLAGIRAAAVLAFAGERQGQRLREGYDDAHDDAHTKGELSLAAACYSINAAMVVQHGDLPPCFIPKNWPWERRWWRPSRRGHAKRDLEKAGGLLLAEWERLDRLEKAAAGRGEK